jgi:type VI secretion system secreted protein VgrG
MTAGQSYSSVAANAATLFSREGGIKAIAGNGNVTMQANTGELEILADKEVVILSVNDGIEIKASKKIVLHAGQSSITLEGGNITFACPGNFTVKSAKHNFDGGGKQEASFVPLPSGQMSLFSRKVRLTDASSGAPLANTPYFIRLRSGAVFHGVSGEDGFTDVAQGDSAEAAKVHVGHSALKEIAKLGGKR